MCKIRTSPHSSEGKITGETVILQPQPDPDSEPCITVISLALLLSRHQRRKWLLESHCLHYYATSNTMFTDLWGMYLGRCVQNVMWKHFVNNKLFFRLLNRNYASHENQTTGKEFGILCRVIITEFHNPTNNFNWWMFAHKINDGQFEGITAICHWPQYGCHGLIIA